MNGHVSTIDHILKLVPHRYPFLLIDRITGFEPHETLVALKNVTYNEPFFQGHFPIKPVMPGVLILEAMAQACGLLATRSTGITVDDGVILYFAGIDKARFKRPVVPGDQLVITAKALRTKRDIWKFEATGTVDGVLVCSASLMCAVKAVEEVEP